MLLLATMVTLVGPSVGYAIAHRVPGRVVMLWGGFSVAALLALPFGLRALVGAMGVRGHGGLVVGMMVLAGGVVLSGFHAVFLPRAARTAVSLPALYAAELEGRVRRAHAHRRRAVLSLRSRSRRRPRCSCCTSASRVCSSRSPLRPRRRRRRSRTRASTTPAARPLLRGLARAAGAAASCRPRYSPYQRIDVIDDERGRRALYLDGIWFFRSHAFDGHNRFLAEVPGARSHRGRGPALVIGSGSFSSAAYLRHLGYEVTVVELDEAVARIGFLQFGEVHGLAPGEVKVWIGDARRFLKRDHGLVRASSRWTCPRPTTCAPRSCTRRASTGSRPRASVPPAWSR